MALENDELPKASDKTADKLAAASGITKAVTDEKPPKPIKEKTNLEELDEVELETLLKETLTYKSPRDRDCRSSLFNKLLVSAEDSIRKDSALNASGSEAVRHRNPQATSRRSRYQPQRGGNNTFTSGHQAGKHGTGGAGDNERKGGRNCTGAGGGSGGGSIADKGTLGGSLNNLTVEDLYESISQHLQQRPEKSVSARQRTGGSLPCNVNAGLITPCETPLFASELKSPPIDTSSSSAANIQQNCSSATNSSTITTVTTTASISPTVTTSTYCLTTSSCSSSGIIYGLNGNNTSVDSVVPPGVITVAPDASLPPHKSHGTISAVSSCSTGGGGAATIAAATTTGSCGVVVRDSCVIEVEQDCSAGAGGTDGTTPAGDMIGIKQPQRTPQPSQTKPPLPSTPAPNPTPQPTPSTFTNNATNFLSTNTTNCSTLNTTATTPLSSSANNPLLGGGGVDAFNIPHIDDDGDDYIIEEDDQHRRFQRQLNYTAKQHDHSTATNDDGGGTELRPMGTGRRLQQAMAGYEASSTSAAERAALSTADYYFLAFREEHDRKQSDKDDVERRPLLLNMEGDEGGAVAAAAVKGRVATGGGPMKIIGQGPQIKPSPTDSLHKQLLNSSIQHNATPATPSQPPPLTPNPPNKRPSLKDINLNDLIKSAALKNPAPLSHHHPAQQQTPPHHQHTGAVRISSLSSSNMLNLNHRRLQQQQQQLDDGEPMDLMDEVVIGVPSTLTGTMGGSGASEGGGSRAVGSFLSERTIHVGDVVESPASSRQSDQDAPTTYDVTKNCGILPNKKIDDNGNHVTKPRKKTKPPEAVVRAEEVEGHRGDIAFDINKLVAFINGNEDNTASGNVAKSAKTAKSSVKLQQQQQQHRGSVSGTGNNRAGGKSVDAEHHTSTHSRRHQNHHHNQQNQQHNSHSNTATNKYQPQLLHRANSLEEMPTTTLEEFHANESEHTSGKVGNTSNNGGGGGKQVNNPPNKVSYAQQSTEPNANKKSCVNSISDGASNVNSVQSSNATTVSSGETSVAASGGAVVASTTNRGRGVLRATKSNAEKSGGSRSGGSAHRGSVCTSAGAGSGGDGGANLMQPRRSWTNADPSPLQAIQHGATTASAENLETDFTLVNSKKKKGKKQQQRRNSVGSRTPINTPQTITSPPTNNRNNNHRQHNNNNHTNNSTAADNHAPSGDQQRSITVNLASLVQASVATSQCEDCGSSDGDNAAYLLAAVDGASANGAVVASTVAAPFVGIQSATMPSLPNLTSYASITKSHVATQQPTVHIPPQPQTAHSNTNTPKWPTTATNTNTTTTITATMLTTAPNNGVVATNNNTTTTTATVVHPETVVVAVQVKVVTNRSQEQQTDDIVPTTFVEADGGGCGGDYVMKQQQISGGGGERQQQNVGQPPNDMRQHHQISTDHPLSLNDMQRWPSINNNKSSLHTNHIIEQPSDHQQQQHSPDIINANKSGNSAHIVDTHQNNVATWPTLGNPKHTKQSNINSSCVPIVSAADIAAKDVVKIVTSDRVVVRSAANVSINKVTCVKSQNDATLGVGHSRGIRADRDDRIIVKDDRRGAAVDARNKMNSVRHGGDKPNLVVHAQTTRPVEVQSYVVQHNVVHPVLVTQHIHHTQHIPPQIISLIPITKLPPPNLIDHTTPPPPNFIQPQQVHHINHMAPPQQHYPPPPYNQPPQQQIIIHPQQNNVLYTPIHLPANIPDVQMIEHQLQLQHNNNNNNNNVHTKNTYNQQQSGLYDGKSSTKYSNNQSVDNNTQQHQQQCNNDQQQSVYQHQSPADYQSLARRPAVVIMRDLSVSAQMGGDGHVAAAAVDDDTSCCELTFGFDVNEELLSLQHEDYANNVSECRGPGVARGRMYDVAADGDTTVVAVVDACVQQRRRGRRHQSAAKDVSALFERRFVVPDCCTVQAEFNYEKIVDFVATAWHEAISDTNDGKCDFYQDL